MIRVLIADDSSTARGLLRSILENDPDVRVIGEATNGLEAVERTQQLRPDLVTMDLRMPLLDGLEATKEIMITAPTPIIIVTASANATEVETGLHTLRAGALAVMPKPPGPGAPRFEDAARELVATVKAMAQVKVVRHWRLATAPAPRGPAGADTFERGQVIAIAASTGGPAALYQLLADLPGDFPVPLLIVQHISPGFVTGLAEYLTKAGTLHVQVARHGEHLAHRTAYLAPDGLHLGVGPGRTVELDAAPPVGGFRPSATHLFASVARAFGDATVAVILTGMGEDGVEGLRAVRQAGGQIIAQDEKTALVFGMPGAAVAAGLPHMVLPLERIAPQLVRLVGEPHED